MQDALRRGRQAIQSALQTYTPNAVFAGFSGGDDSLMTTHLLHQMLPERARTAHINTGIGFETTRKYVRDICEKREWRLEEVHAKEDCGQDYDEIVRGNCTCAGGFPGPAAHQPPNSYIYDRLKGRAVLQLHREWKGEYGGKILLVTGIRKDESDRRMGYDDSVIDPDPAFSGVIWVNPIYYVSAAERDQYIDRHGLQRNPVSRLIGSSGECLCGAFDEDGQRLEELRAECELLGEMDLYERIASLQKEVHDRYPWRWDERPPEWFAEAQNGQLGLEGLPSSGDQNRVARMCVGCGKARA